MLQEAQSPDSYPLPIVGDDILTTVFQQFQANREQFIATAEMAVERDAVDFAFFCRNIVQLKFGITNTRPVFDHMVVTAELLRRAAVCETVEAQAEPFLMGRARGLLGRNLTKHVLPLMIYGSRQREVLTQVNYRQAQDVLTRHDHCLSEAITGHAFLPDVSSVERDGIVRPTLVLYGLMYQLAARR